MVNICLNRDKFSESLIINCLNTIYNDYRINRIKTELKPFERTLYLEVVECTPITFESRIKRIKGFHRLINLKSFERT